MLGFSRLSRADYFAAILAVAFLALGVWRLVTDDVAFGVFYLVLAVGWLLIALYRRRRTQS